MENKLGKVISNLRKEKGITQRDLAEALNISDKAISRWECGTSRPTLEMMFQISKYFNVSYNDLITARISDDHEDDKIVEEIIKEFSDIGKKKIKRIKTILLISIVIIVILGIGIIFTNTYNRFRVYRVHSSNSEINQMYGIYVETNVKDTLYLGDLKLREKEITTDDIVSVDIYYKEDGKEYILQNYSSLENIYLVDTQSYIEIDNLSKYFDKLYIRVTIIKENGVTEKYDGKLEFVLDFSNNKIFYHDEFNTENLGRKITSKKEIDVKEVLKENGFKKTNDNVLKKTEKNSKISYIIDSKIVYYNYERNGFNYQYRYLLNTNILEVTITDENLTIIQNYTYDVGNNKMECRVGSCSDYKKVMEILEEKILYLFK